MTANIHSLLTLVNHASATVQPSILSEARGDGDTYYSRPSEDTLGSNGLDREAMNGHGLTRGYCIHFIGGLRLGGIMNVDEIPVLCSVPGSGG